MGRRKIYPDSLNPEIRRLYIAGNSLQRIAQELDMHPEIVKRRLRSMGIPIRNRGEAMKNFHARRKAAKKKSS